MKKNTICHKLWDELYIDQYGDIYPCCHEKPEKIGTIYENTLNTLLNSEKMLRIREQSKKGQLTCYQICNIKQFRVLEDNLPLQVSPDNMAVLKILFGEQCNINCKMCWQDSKNKKVIDFEQLKKATDFSGFKHIIIQGGEPFVNKQVLDFFDYLIELGKTVSFLTNGLLITEELTKKIVLHSQFIHISLNAASKRTHEKINYGSNWERVLANILRLQTYKTLYNSNLIITGHMTIVEDNIHEIPDFIKQYKQLGLDYIKFGYDESIPRFLQKNSQIYRTLCTEIQGAIRNIEASDIELHRLRMLKFI